MVDSARTDTVYEIGDLPPLGTVPRRMYASVIRPERYGEPRDAYDVELVDVPEIPRGFVLVAMMAAGINYNNVWAALGKPVDVVAARQRQGDTLDFHIGGSEGSGIVWAVGETVTSVRPGDEVVLSGCRWDETAADVRLGLDPMLSATQKVWGYETNFGSFAQFTLVADYQCHPKPLSLTWEQAACFLLSGATAYRQLTHWAPNTVRPGSPVLVWGAAGGLGSMACQLTRQLGGRPIAVVSSMDKVAHCRGLGAVGVVNRSDFTHWGSMPDLASPEFAKWAAGARSFGARLWEILGERRSPDIVFEHPGEDTIPTSMYVCASGGMVVICGATSGYLGEIDLRVLWMRQKRLQGSHFADLRECRAVIDLLNAGLLDPCLGQTYPFEKIGLAHQDMRDGTAPPGNLAALVGAKTMGLGAHA